VFDEAFLQPFVNVKRYYVTLVNQKEFKSVMGEPKLCDVAKKYSPQKKSENPKAEKSEPSPAEDKPKPEKEEKQKSWLDFLPPTSMPFDSFKRLYSNCPSNNFRETFLPLMWNGGPIPKSPTDEVNDAS